MVLSKSFTNSFKRMKATQIWSFGNTFTSIILGSTHQWMAGFSILSLILTLWNPIVLKDHLMKFTNNVENMIIWLKIKAAILWKIQLELKLKQTWTFNHYNQQTVEWVSHHSFGFVMAKKQIWNWLQASLELLSRKMDLLKRKWGGQWRRHEMTRHERMNFQFFKISKSSK